MKAFVFISIFILMFAIYGCTSTTDNDTPDQPPKMPTEKATGVNDVFTDDDSAEPPQIPS